MEYPKKVRVLTDYGPSGLLLYCIRGSWQNVDSLPFPIMPIDVWDWEDGEWKATAMGPMDAGFDGEETVLARKGALRIKYYPS
jgi:hypothetical protein